MTVTEHGYTTEQARDLSRAGMEQCRQDGRDVRSNSRP